VRAKVRCADYLWLQYRSPIQLLCRPLTPSKSLLRMQEVKSSTGIVKTWEFDRICICKIEDRKAQEYCRVKVCLDRAKEKWTNRFGGTLRLNKISC
jgi:hypothetical protein